MKCQSLPVAMCLGTSTLSVRTTRHNTTICPYVVSGFNFCSQEDGLVRVDHSYNTRGCSHIDSLNMQQSQCWSNIAHSQSITNHWSIVDFTTSAWDHFLIQKSPQGLSHQRASIPCKLLCAETVTMIDRVSDPAPSPPQ